MKLSFNSWFLAVAATAMVASSSYNTATALTSSSVPNHLLKTSSSSSSSTTKHDFSVDSNADATMSQYETALKGAFQQATTTATTAATATVPATQHPPATTEVHNADIAMSQYEAALKAAFEQATVPVTDVPRDTVMTASSSATATATAVTNDNYSAVSSHMMKSNHHAVDNDSTSRSFPKIDATTAMRPPSTIVFENETQEEPAVPQQEQEQKQQQGQQPGQVLQALTSQQQLQQQDEPPNWDTISTDITKKIEIAELEQGGEPLSPSAKGEIVGKVLAGSAALGAATIHSPLLIGAALGYASTHLLGGKNGEVLSNASKTAVLDAVKFSKHQLALEDGDVSKATKRIMEHIQHETTDRMEHLQHDMTVSAEQLGHDLKAAPTKLVQHTTEYMNSDDFKSMPSRGMNALTTFWNSDEVKKAQQSALQAIKNGLESEEIKAVQKRATLSMNDITSSSSTKN
mgnify:CR=1 FL=1